MKIAYVAAGAAGMYCGSCLHDNVLAAALLRRGEDVLLIPTYTPLRTDDPNVSLPQLFLGGINVYLQQKFALFRHTPRWLDRFLDTPRLVSWLAARGASTAPEELGDLTVSMLEGDRGYQRKEMDRFVDWLATDVKPDVVHLSNSMLSGMAQSMRRRLGVPIVCTLSGEDIFLEKLREPHYTRARELLKQAGSHVDRYVALNEYYADFMSDYLAVERERVAVIPHGVDVERFPARNRGDDGPLVIGYLARVDPAKGLHQLVEAFCRLAQDRELVERRPLKLRVAGYLSQRDRPYVEEQRRRIAEAGLEGSFEYVGEVDFAGKVAFLHSLDVMSVPGVYAESKGISILEAMACGVPVVVPEHGTFPEMLEDIGGGLMFEPGNVESLAEPLKRLALDSELRCRLGEGGRQAIAERYTADGMAERTVELYAELTGAAEVQSASSE